MPNLSSLVYVGPYQTSLGETRFLPNAGARFRRPLPNPYHAGPLSFCPPPGFLVRPTVGQIWPRFTSVEKWREAVIMGVEVNRSTGFALTASVPAAIPFDTVVEDDNNFWNVSNPTRLTVQTAGWYFVNAQIAGIAGGNDVFSLMIRVNGSSNNRVRQDTPIADLINSNFAQVQALIKLAVGDYVEVWANIETIGLSLDGGPTKTFVQLGLTGAIPGPQGPAGTQTTDASLLTSGILDPARLDVLTKAKQQAQTAYKDEANIFTDKQRINGGLGVGRDSNSPGEIKATGGIWEHNRVLAMGQAANHPFDAADFSSSAGTWVVDAADVLVNRIAFLSGKFVCWNVWIKNSTITGTPNFLILKLPTGLSLFGGMTLPCSYNNASSAWLQGFVFNDAAGAGATSVRIYNSTFGGTNWANGTNNTSVLFTIVFEVQ